MITSQTPLKGACSGWRGWSLEGVQSCQLRVGDAVPCRQTPGSPASVGAKKLFMQQSQNQPVWPSGAPFWLGVRRMIDFALFSAFAGRPFDCRTGFSGSLPSGVQKRQPLELMP